MAPRYTNDQKGPEAIGEVVSRLFAARGWGRHQERLRLEKAWEDAIDPKFAPHTRLSGIKRKVLEIEVRSGVLLQELTQFHKKKILEKMRQLLTGVMITDVRFRPGTW